jgi:hypothetical protein
VVNSVDTSLGQWVTRTSAGGNYEVYATVVSGTLCAGTTGSITSSTSVDGIDYQLYDSSNTAVGDAVSGTGFGLTWLSIDIGLGYYAKATNASSSCVSVVRCTLATTRLCKEHQDFLLPAVSGELLSWAN